MLEKIKSLQINFALIAFIAFTVKITLFSATFPDSIILLGLGMLYGYTQYLKRFQTYKLEDAVMKDLHEVKAAISHLNIRKTAEKMSEVKRYF
jgi:hypothetical protein